LRGLDIFCGPGGSSTGARLAGIDVVAAIDMDPIATGTYKKNFPDAKVITNQLEVVDPFSLRKSIGPVDVLLASPECINHRCAKGAAPRSEESRATAMEVVRFATAFEPCWLVLENVVHMRPWSRYGELKKELVALGYHLSEQVLDASDFGVPQSRRRLFLVGDMVKTPTLVSKRRIARKKTVKSILDPEKAYGRRPPFIRNDGRKAPWIGRSELSKCWARDQTSCSSTMEVMEVQVGNRSIVLLERLRPWIGLPFSSIPDAVLK
jgi:DNA (cytosine-5)-methyltransferase 1